MKKLLTYRAEYVQGEVDTYSDVFYGSAYQQCQKELFNRDYDIALAILTDGFYPFKGSSSQMTIIHVAVLSPPPETRYESCNMLQICIILGPKASKTCFLL